MRFSMKSAIAAIVFAAGGTAMAAPVSYVASVTNGSVNNALALLSDGDIAGDYTYWQDARNVWTTDTGTTIRFDFSAPTQITGALGTFDNNDDYVFTFYNGATQVYQAMVSAYDGFVSVYAGGVETFEGSDPLDVHYHAPFDFSASPFVATSAVLSFGPNNDAAMGIGEVQFFGGAVPEPASWAMMVAGFGLAGAALRSRKQASVAFG